jgi:DNA-binding CsgD family transcriptional regulator
MTPTLRETLELLCQGYSNREIAERRHYSEEAIQDHTKRLLALFGARRRAHLAALAVAEGHVDPRRLRSEEAA